MIFIVYGRKTYVSVAHSLLASSARPIIYSVLNIFGRALKRPKLKGQQVNLSNISAIGPIFIHLFDTHVCRIRTIAYKCPHQGTRPRHCFKKNIYITCFFSGQLASQSLFLTISLLGPELFYFLCISEEFGILSFNP